MINPKPCKCNPTNNRQMEANEKKSKNLLIIKNIIEHVLEEHKHAETKITKQQKTDKNTHAQQTNNNMVNQKPCKYNPTIEASEKRQKTKQLTQQKAKKNRTKELQL